MSAIAHTSPSSSSTLGPYASIARGQKHLSREEERTLILRYQQEGDDKAAHVLVLHHLHVVIPEAYRCRSKHVTLQDLVQEGLVGLLEALKRFDLTRNVRFRTYAQWWVRAQILKYIRDNHRMVRLGTTQAQRTIYYNLSKTEDALRSSDEHVDPKAIAATLDVPEQDVVSMLTRLRQPDLSLDARAHLHTTLTLGELLYHDTPTPEACVSYHHSITALQNAIDRFTVTLETRDRRIWDSRIYTDAPLTLAQLSAELEISRERVRQLQARITSRFRTFLSNESACDTPIWPTDTANLHAMPAHVSTAY